MNRNSSYALHIKRPLLAYAGAYFLSILAALLLLTLSAYLPQDRIDQNFIESVDLLKAEGRNMRIADYSNSARLDNYTDALILMESQATNASDLSSVLTNPMFFHDDDPIKSVAMLAEDLSLEPNSHYVRYWMGFRAPVRLALTFLNYAQLRRIIAFALFTLIAATAWSVSENLNARTAFAFVMSIIAVRPYIICNSMQFSCCFFLGMGLMLLIPGLHRKASLEGLFFFESGILTMYFDFYTAPLLTFGLPIVYLLALRAKNSQPLNIKSILLDIVIWFSGYVLMWIGKLFLTTLLTPINGFRNGFSSMATRIGITKVDSLAEHYSIIQAFKKIITTVVCDRTGMFMCMILVLICLCILIIALKRKALSFHALMKNKAFCIPCVLPFVWFAVAAQPTSIHSWFQYRGIAVFYWALGCWICSAMQDSPSSATKYS